jgi:hypothetical protein
MKCSKRGMEALVGLAVLTLLVVNMELLSLLLASVLLLVKEKSNRSPSPVLLVASENGAMETVLALVSIVLSAAPALLLLLPMLTAV